MKIPFDITERLLEHCKTNKLSAIELVHETGDYSVLIIGPKDEHPLNLMLRGALCILASMDEATQTQGRNIMLEDDIKKAKLN